MIRILVLADGTEYGTASESWRHGAFIGWGELGAVTGRSERGLRRLVKQLEETGSATIRVGGSVVRLIARIGE